LSPEQIHIVDSNSRRRAQFAFELNGRGYRAHVYESICELERFKPADGLVLLSGEDDPRALERLREKLIARGNSVPIAMYAARPEASKVVDAMLSGAVDYLEWPLQGDPADIVGQVKRRASAMVQSEQRSAAAARLVSTLSPREREVLSLMIDGQSSRSMAALLKISPRTVEIHRGHLLRKLGVSSTAGAVRVGIHAGIEAE
jgi:FixJ family two-component response regulator